MSRKRWADDAGAVAPLAAFSFLMIIALVALVVDVGYSYAVKRRVQQAADSAALAACDQLIETPTQPALAQSAGRAIALSHATGVLAGLTAADVAVTTNAGALGGAAGVTPWASVRVGYHVPLFFGAVYGRPTADATSQSKAEAQRVSGARYVAPFGMAIMGRTSGVRYEVRSSSGALVSAGGLTASDATALNWTAQIKAPTQPGAYDVKIYYANELGAEETLFDTKRSRETTACRLLVRGAGMPITKIVTSPLFVELEQELRPNFMANVFVDTSSTANVRAPLDPSADPFEYRLLATYPAVYNGLVVAYAHARSPEQPVRSATLNPMLADPDAPVTLTVQMTRFDPRAWSDTRSGSSFKTLYVRGDGNGDYCGDYLPLDMNSVDHGSCGGEPFPASSVTGSPGDWASYGYPGPVHVNDRISRRPGPPLRQLRSFNQVSSAGRFANIPVLMREPSGAYRVLGVVTASLVAVYSPATVAPIQFKGDFVATPHEFDTGVPTAGTNAVFAARLVRP